MKRDLIKEAESALAGRFLEIDETVLFNQKKVLDAFRKNRISPRHFNPSTGYAYNDAGRTGLSALFSDVFRAESAIVSHGIFSGTHAITLALFGLTRPNDLILSVTGKPYDTLAGVISGKDCCSLADYGVRYSEIALKDNKPDIKKIAEFVSKNKTKVVFAQRSKGYEWRETLSIADIAELSAEVNRADKDTVILVDNCYGEFTEKGEPSEAGADVIAGSLIKNPGGGLAPSGGYIAGKAELIELISYRFTAPNVGVEIGAAPAGYLSYYQGLFNAPSVVGGAMKGALLASEVFRALGYETVPSAGGGNDIICSVKFGKREELIKFCRSVQASSPIDSFALPEPSEMPGYNDEVIMAAGTFIQGATLELSADAPIRPPYIGYLQGGLSYAHCKIALAEYLSTLG